MRTHQTAPDPASTLQSTRSPCRRSRHAAGMIGGPGAWKAASRLVYAAGASHHHSAPESVSIAKRDSSWRTQSRSPCRYLAMAYREGEARRLDTGRQAPLIAKESLGSTRKPERALESRDGVRRRDLMSACARLEAAPCRAGRAG